MKNVLMKINVIDNIKNPMPFSISFSRFYDNIEIKYFYMRFLIYLSTDPTFLYTFNYGTLTRHIICSRSVSWLRRSNMVLAQKEKNATKKEAKSMHTVSFSETIISDGVGRLTTLLVTWSCIFLLDGCKRIDITLFVSSSECLCVW